MIPYSRQSISDADIDAVIAVLKSDFLTQGPVTEKFESQVAKICNVRHAIAISSGSAGLHLACLALGLGPTDIFWTSPNTFVSSANAARHCGAKVDFVDVEPDSGNISISSFAEKLKKAQTYGKLPSILMPVHFAGQPCDLFEISELSKRYGVTIIEDAAHALGATYRGGPIGDCRFSACAVFSFHAVKVATTGEGGVIVTNSDTLAAKLRRLRSHGITRTPSEMIAPTHEPWFYEQLELGFNYRMTDIQAALGCSQVARLHEFLSRRQYLADRYTQLLKGLAIELPIVRKDRQSSWHLFVVRIDQSKCAKSRATVFSLLRSKGIGVNVHFIPVHLQPYYRQLGFKLGDFPIAESNYNVSISFPIYNDLTNAQQDIVVAALRSSLQ